MEHKGNRRNLAIARPLLEVLFKAKGRTHAVTKEALRRTGDVINRLARSTLGHAVAAPSPLEGGLP